ncbi:uncharacterized protein BJ171DRAFT_90114 [Polychytrium aggregatum]|uniref:uncharacterized protein n=1 Tax=Polychytrium aggregatum TaxID=110093 RepID=UPI0022FE6D90|nr:uncharacterized protein BJ171DRAFT_90114 [Polychytrium aggregatum]KAI9204822.1 hypothetical protein BJ171DRAFT_90114 [Polychytrium aggregatum]
MVSYNYPSDISQAIWYYATTFCRHFHGIPFDEAVARIQADSFFLYFIKNFIENCNSLQNENRLPLGITTEVQMTSLILVQRAARARGAMLQHAHRHEVDQIQQMAVQDIYACFVVSFMLAQKWNIDVPWDIKAWVLIANEGQELLQTPGSGQLHPLQARVLVQAEREFLSLCSYDLFIQPEEYRQFVDTLVHSEKCWQQVSRMMEMDWDTLRSTSAAQREKRLGRRPKPTEQVPPLLQEMAASFPAMYRQTSGPAAVVGNPVPSLSRFDAAQIAAHRSDAARSGEAELDEPKFDAFRLAAPRLEAARVDMSGLGQFKRDHYRSSGLQPGQLRPETTASFGASIVPKSHIHHLHSSQGTAPHTAGTSLQGDGTYYGFKDLFDLPGIPLGLGSPLHVPSAALDSTTSKFASAQANTGPKDKTTGLDDIPLNTHHPVSSRNPGSLHSASTAHEGTGQGSVPITGFGIGGMSIGAGTQHRVPSASPRRRYHSRSRSLADLPNSSSSLLLSPHVSIRDGISPEDWSVFDIIPSTLREILHPPMKPIHCHKQGQLNDHVPSVAHSAPNGHFWGTYPYASLSTSAVVPDLGSVPSHLQKPPSPALLPPLPPPSALSRLSPGPRPAVESISMLTEKPPMLLGFADTDSARPSIPRPDQGMWMAASKPWTHGLAAASRPQWDSHTTLLDLDV